MRARRRVHPDEDPRAGRWAGLDKNECGLHWDNGKPVPTSENGRARLESRVPELNVRHI